MQQLEQALGSLDCKILIVDDDSPDRTWAVVQKMSLRDPKVRLLLRKSNRGLGAAVIEGFNAACGDVVVCIDADLQHDPRILTKMLEEPMAGSRVVVGSHYVDGGTHFGIDPLANQS